MPFDDICIFVNLVSLNYDPKDLDVEHPSATVTMIKVDDISAYQHLCDVVLPAQARFLEALTAEADPDRVARRLCPSCFINPIGVAFINSDAISPISLLTDLDPEMRAVFAREMRLAGFPLIEDPITIAQPNTKSADDVADIADVAIMSDDAPPRVDLNMTWAMETASEILLDNGDSYSDWIASTGGKCDKCDTYVKLGDQPWSDRLWERFFLQAVALEVKRHRDPDATDPQQNPAL